MFNVNVKIINMRSMPALVIFFLLGWFCPALAGEQFQGAVKKVIDGDTLVVWADNHAIKVRLYGVDCPEYGQPYAREAKYFSQERVLGKRVVIEKVTEDSYGRTIAFVRYGDDLLNEDLVKSGYAWVSPKYCKKDLCDSWKEKERRARKDKLGLWQEAHPESPWQWKRNKRSR
jgi:endonuclease YncB( thermonuclease family)